MNEMLENELRQACKLQDELDTYLARIETTVTELLRGKIIYPEFKCRAVMEKDTPFTQQDGNEKGVLVHVEMSDYCKVLLSTLIEIQKEMGAKDIEVLPNDSSRTLSLFIYLPRLLSFPD